MVLLFIAMLAAAYANRSLLLEQRISANHYRSTQAFEAAEAGLEWALTQLNAGRVDAQCRPTTASGHAPFVFRAAGAASAASGLFGQPPSEGAEDSFMRPVCVARDGGGGWDCHCLPTGRPPASTLTDAGQLDRPLFVLTISSARMPGKPVTERYPRVLNVTAEGCNRVLLEQDGASWRCRKNSPEGRAYAELNARAALVPALATAPTALLTAKGAIDLGGAASTLARGSAGDGAGPALLAGSAIVNDGAAQLLAAAGTPAASLKVAGSASLASLTDDQFFAAFFGMPPAPYGRLPGVRRLTCLDAADCATKLQHEFDGGHRQLLVVGDLPLSNLTLGSPTDPVVLIVNGRLTLGSEVRLHGFVFGEELRTGASAANSQLRGAAAFGAVTLTGGGLSLVYEPDSLSRLNLLTGSWVRVPGSWRAS
jgi:hypothetical protein